MKSLAELAAIRENMKSKIQLRESSDNKTRIVVGMATCGIAAGARPVLMAISELVAQKSLPDVSVTQTGCIGICQYEPVVEVHMAGKDKVTYVKMTAEKAKRVIEEHIIGGKVVEEYTIGSSTAGEGK